MTKKFKVGDRVRVLSDRANLAAVLAGDIGIIESINYLGVLNLYEVVMERDSRNWGFRDEDIELVSRPSTSTSKGIKYDSNKPDLSLLSFDALSEIAKAFEFGAKKYGRYNYLGGMEWTRIGGACLRHVFQWLWVEDNDSESGLSHLAHAGACIIMLLDYVTKGLGTDNRFKKKD